MRENDKRLSKSSTGWSMKVSIAASAIVQWMKYSRTLDGKPKIA
jgi:hypothetical protein